MNQAKVTAELWLLIQNVILLKQVTADLPNYTTQQGERSKNNNRKRKNPWERGCSFSSNQNLVSRLVFVYIFIVCITYVYNRRTSPYSWQGLYNQNGRKLTNGYQFGNEARKTTALVIDIHNTGK